MPTTFLPYHPPPSLSTSNQQSWDSTCEMSLEILKFASPLLAMMLFWCLVGLLLVHSECTVLSQCLQLSGQWGPRTTADCRLHISSIPSLQTDRPGALALQGQGRNLQVRYQVIVMRWSAGAKMSRRYFSQTRDFAGRLAALILPSQALVKCFYWFAKCQIWLKRLANIFSKWLTDWLSLKSHETSDLSWISNLPSISSNWNKN